MSLFRRRDPDDEFGTPQKEKDPLFNSGLFKPLVSKEETYDKDWDLGDDEDDNENCDLEEEGVEDETGYIRWYSDDDLDYAQEAERITKDMTYEELCSICKNHDIDVESGDSELVLRIRIAMDMDEYHDTWFKD